ncbi:hypothetical protein A3D42_03105 [Candidatus Nomurabacteria bacterium RIFCSPHIGHO2_02_FULL_41_18]|uniref:Septum formation initiator n=1 Tax=Candidatus Nomurabacteria bacterium RIFCSPHIGHO2_02_FULL_41_18 TaxID=1801754 RepID=A0A1F6W696_9BACT|nr:MAG: hypothetical protein A3D42_03105 [Candidatus Nomurabacteria bacterium RIFCSPHIGHO2_02_FULL_41_18]OGJ00301.1 MAG: hypothetical protein A3I90_01990 [Candidatus Nomurabacteria bacterium RIFCSPLOWO2_02_FULL_41_9]
MRNFQEKKKLKKILGSPAVLLVFFVFLVFFVWVVIRFLGKLFETSKNREIAESRVVELREAREYFFSQIENLKTEKGIEENLREKFPVVKDGEGLIVVVDEKNSEKTKDEKSQNGFLFFIKNWFK